MGPKIFINYRKDDSSWNSVALYQELLKHFPKENIFKDFNTIVPGSDFAESIGKALESCDVLLVLISRQWLDIKDKAGNLRIRNDDDYVRLEIATALKRGISVIPVLFDDVTMPQAADLPEDIKKLALRQYIEIDKTRFEDDSNKLVSIIRATVPSTGPGELPGTGGGSSKKIAGVFALVLVIAAAIYFLFFNNPHIDDTTKNKPPNNTQPINPVSESKEPANKEPVINTNNSNTNSDLFQVLSILPKPTEVLNGTTPFAINIRLHYRLFSADEALLVPYLEQFDANNDCIGSHHTIGSCDPSQIPIKRGEGDITLKILYNPDYHSAKSAPGNNGHVAPNASLWAGTDSQGKVIEMQTGLWDNKDYCYSFITP